MNVSSFCWGGNWNSRKRRACLTSHSQWVVVYTLDSKPGSLSATQCCLSWHHLSISCSHCLPIYSVASWGKQAERISKSASVAVTKKKVPGKLMGWLRVSIFPLSLAITFSVSGGLFPLAFPWGEQKWKLFNLDFLQVPCLAISTSLYPYLSSCSRCKAELTKSAENARAI